MYFNVGCHEAYALNGDFEDYSIYFEDDKVLKNTLLGKNLLADEAFDINLDNGSLKLDYDAYFTGQFEHNGETYYKDSIIVDNVKSKRAVMSYKGEEQFSIYYQDFRNLVIWTNSKGFLAIEPWSGLPDFASTDHKIENKRSIDKLAPNESKTFYHSITFN
jgi:galactose mutarotase-like enzyme